MGNIGIVLFHDRSIKLSSNIRLLQEKKVGVSIWHCHPLQSAPQQLYHSWLMAGLVHINLGRTWSSAGMSQAKGPIPGSTLTPQSKHSMKVRAEGICLSPIVGNAPHVIRNLAQSLGAWTHILPHMWQCLFGPQLLLAPTGVGQQTPDLRGAGYQTSVTAQPAIHTVTVMEAKDPEEDAWVQQKDSVVWDQSTT